MAAAVPLRVVSAHTTSERRVSPEWTVAQLKARLEPITGIAVEFQRLVLRGEDVDVSDEEGTLLGSLGLVPQAELQVIDTRPPEAQPDYTDPTGVQKYEMPQAEYAARTDSVLAWKKKDQLGRFDPAAVGAAEARVRGWQRDVEEREIQPGRRARLLPIATDARRGTVRYVGPIPELPGPAGGVFVGVALDEPVGKHDGSVPASAPDRAQGQGQEDQEMDDADGGERGLEGGKAGRRVRYFECAPRHGVFLRPERVEVGDFPVLDELGDDDEDMEEI